MRGIEAPHQKEAFSVSDSTYGFRRVHAWFTRWGHAAAPEPVRLLMCELGMVGCQPGSRRHSLTLGEITAPLVYELV
ncbi:IS3 family transposase [Streptomyces sp. NPDC055085]